MIGRSHEECRHGSGQRGDGKRTASERGWPAWNGERAAGRENARRAGEFARNAGEFSLAGVRDRRERRGRSAQSEHGLLASIVPLSVRLIAALLRLGVLLVVIGIFVVIAYIFLNGGLPF
jgi:hypothetical protein